MKAMKLSAVAGVVTAALSACAVNAASFEQRHFDASASAMQAVFSPAVAKQKALAERATVSGNASHFDRELGKATFVWQGVGQAKPDLSVVKPEERKAYVADFYVQSLTGISTDKNAASKAVMSSLSEQKRGAIIAKYKQEVHGVEVFNREYNVMLDKEYNLVAGSGYFADAGNAAKSFALLAGFTSAEDSIKRAFKDVAGIEVNLHKQKEAGGYVHYTATSLNDAKEVVGEPRAKKVLFDLKGKLTAAYYVEVQVADKGSLESDYYSYVVGADNGKVLFRKDLKSHASDFNYRVYANADGYPMEGPHGDVIPAASPDQVDTSEILPTPMVSLSHYKTLSTQDPWLSDDATMTLGNNVFAYADVVAPQGYTEGDFTAETTSDYTFDYPLKADEVANSYNNRKAAIVNLFYMNNFLHDFFYDHGFDETSNVAQINNYGRGGVEGDPIEAQAQDYSGLNNANMATPADGASPRMQMYLYDSKDAKVGIDFGVTVTSHSAVGLLDSSKVSAFGQRQFSDIQGNVVRLVDGNDTDSGSIYDGCEEPTNAADLAGKIAIIDRGSCTFTAKVLFAQEAGAIAAIIVNNSNDGSPAPMGGDDPAVTIPNMGLNYADGHAIYDLLANGETVSVSMFNKATLKDGTFDNGIIAHEWGHYISNRLVGNSAGLINFQGNAMGEGWGDFHSLLFIAKADDANIPGNDQFQTPYGSGTYVEDFYWGIRRVPYSTNMDINPLSFRHITEGAGGDVGLPGTYVGSPHAPGEIWATMLWESYVALINEHGFAEAQSRMADYLVGGYKMTPIAPLYTEARDAILSTAYAADQNDYKLILGAFAKRGMGLGAVAPSRSSTTLEGVVESNKTELATFALKDVELNADFNGAELGYCSNDGILDKGETGTVTVTIANRGSEMLSGTKAQLTVVSGQDVTFENDGLITFGSLAPFAEATSAPVKLTLNDAATADELEIEISFPEIEAGDDIVEALTQNYSATVNFDFTERAPVSSMTMDNMESAASTIHDLVENVLKGGEQAKGTQDFDNGGNIPFFASFGFDLGEQAMVLNNNEFESDVAVETRPFEIGYAGDFEVSFWHFYGIEEGWDGGVVEIRVNDGDWVDVTEVGGQFAVGYDGALEDNPAQSLQERPTFTGRNISDQGEFGNNERINFGTALNGNRAQLRFRISSDSNTADYGWWIDNLQISNVVTPVFSDVVAGDTYACDNVAPVVSVSGTTTLKESATGTLSAVATDRNGDALSYGWTQLSGPTATLSGTNTATLTFTPGSISADTQLVFELAVSDGSATTKETVQVQVTNEADVVAKKSSSGSAGFIALLLMPLVALRRRWMR